MEQFLKEEFDRLRANLKLIRHFLKVANADRALQEKVERQIALDRISAASLLAWLEYLNSTVISRSKVKSLLEGLTLASKSLITIDVKAEISRSDRSITGHVAISANTEFSVDSDP